MPLTLWILQDFGRSRERRGAGHKEAVEKVYCPPALDQYLTAGRDGQLRWLPLPTGQRCFRDSAAPVTLMTAARHDRHLHALPAWKANRACLPACAGWCAGCGTPPTWPPSSPSPTAPPASQTSPCWRAAPRRACWRWRRTTARWAAGDGLGRVAQIPAAAAAPAALLATEPLRSPPPLMCVSHLQIIFYKAVRTGFDYVGRLTCPGTLGPPLCLDQLQPGAAGGPSRLVWGDTGERGRGGALGCRRRQGKAAVRDACCEGMQGPGLRGKRPA